MDLESINITTNVVLFRIYEGGVTFGTVVLILLGILAGLGIGMLIYKKFITRSLQVSNGGGLVCLAVVIRTRSVWEIMHMLTRNFEDFLCILKIHIKIPQNFY